MATDKILFFIMIYGVGLAVLSFLTHTLREAGREHGSLGLTTANYMIAGLWAWATLANAYALVVPNGFIWLAPAIALPILIGTGITFLDSVKDVLRKISLPKLVVVQVYRNAGAVFLIAYFVFGTYMSREFSVNAGWGDVLTGMLAVPTAIAAFYRMPLWPVVVVVWCIIGISDLILAPITAITYGGPRTDDFPINAIPIFFGPPLGILLHIFTLRALWLQRTGKDEGTLNPR